MDVLVVDPGELGELLATLLSQYGLTASSVQTGEAALGLALDQKPTVVVIEAELADTSGLELAELLREELGSRIVLTHAPGLPLSDAAIAARIRALDVAFARPFRSLALIETVARLCGKPLVRPAGGSDAASSSSSSAGGSAGGSFTPASPLSSTEGMAIEELAEHIEIPFDEDEAEARVAYEPLADDEVSFAEVGAASRAALSPLSSTRRHDDEAEIPELVLDAIVGHADEDEATVPSGTSTAHAPATTEATGKPVSAEAARPLSEVLDREARQKQQGAFSPGELAQLWQRVKERRANTAAKAEQPAPEGLLTPRALADLLDAFHQSQTTGELWLEHASGSDRLGKRVLLLKRGVLAGARSNLVGEDLLTLLKKRKAVDDDDIIEVETLVKARAFKTTADALVGLDLVPAPTLRGLVEEHVRRVAIGAFQMSAGRYRLTLEGRAAKEPVPAQVFVGDAIVHAMLVTESDASLEKAAPDDARFAPSTDGAYGLEHLKLSPQEARVVIAMDGTKTISDLVTLFTPLPGAAAPGALPPGRLVRGLAAGLFCLHLTRYAGRGPASARRISFF